MTNQPSSQWNAKRFVQTLNYFADAGLFDASKVYSMQLMLSKFEYAGLTQ